MCECGGVSCGNRPSYYAYKTPIYKRWLMANGTLTEKSMWETEKRETLPGNESQKISMIKLTERNL